MKIIGVSGLARAGKDTIADHLAKEIELIAPNLRVKRESLASFLRDEMKTFIFEKFNKDVFNLEGEEKERLRPLLVAYGYAKRIETNGCYFTDLLQQKMQSSDADVYIISDIRYADTEADELFWLKNQGGKLIHVKRSDYGKNNKKVFIKDPNEDERRNDPVLEKNADFNICWETFNEGPILNREADALCQKFIYENIKYFL